VKNAKTQEKIVSERYNKTLHKQEETTVCYYISSLTAKPGDFNHHIRPHWVIENKSTGNYTFALVGTLSENGRKTRP
jgi:predicted transposase YbfD/YdcC